MTEGLTPAQKLIGDFAPKLVQLTDEVLFGDIWERPGLSPRDRSLITVTTLVALYRTEQLGSHLRRALENGLTKDELVEAIIHMTFYAGWPNGMTAITQLKDIIENEAEAQVSAELGPPPAAVPPETAGQQGDPLAKEGRDAAAHDRP